MSTTINTNNSKNNNTEIHDVVIIGGGLVGLVLSLAIQHFVGVTPVVYEKITSYEKDVGAGMGFYPNGLRVVRDVSPSLLRKIQEAGFPFLQRRWQRHDGTEVAVADETVLSSSFDDDDDSLQSLGIRRWKLQNILYEAVVEAGIPVHFEKQVKTVHQDDDDSDDDDLVHVEFTDGTIVKTRILFAADGNKSTIRKVIFPDSALKYTGVTCVMGMAETSASERGISFPSNASKQGAHACFFPTCPEEECFQMHCCVKESDADPGNWGTLSQSVGQEECRILSQQMQEDGWAPQYIEPLLRVTRAVRVGFCRLEPPLHTWVDGRIILIGDAAHPPVPYTGQGAQMGLEDAGTISLLLKELCLDENGTFDMANFEKATRLYQDLRIPRTLEINGMAHKWGQRQAKEFKNQGVRLHATEEKLKREVFFHETLACLIPGSTYDYSQGVAQALERSRNNNK